MCIAVLAHPYTLILNRSISMYIIYKTTNLINGKFYIGKTSTEKLSAAKSGKDPWNKGIKTGVVTAGCFSKGNVPWNKGKPQARYTCTKCGYESASKGHHTRWHVPKCNS